MGMHWGGWEGNPTTVSVSHPSRTHDPLILPCTVLHANKRWLSLQWSVYLIKNHYAPVPLGPDLKWAPACNAVDSSMRWLQRSRWKHEPEILSDASCQRRWVGTKSHARSQLELYPRSEECLLATQLVLRSIHLFVWKAVLVSCVVKFWVMMNLVLNHAEIGCLLVSFFLGAFCVIICMSSLHFPLMEYQRSNSCL